MSAFGGSVFGAAFGGRAQGLRLERMRASPRFDGEHFRNTHVGPPSVKKGTLLPTLKEYFGGGQRRIPTGVLPILTPTATWAKPAETGLRATWLGHSTVLLELDGVRVLTDPVWGDRVSPMKFAGPRRFHPVPVPIASLPVLDVVIISHDHYDHLDYSTIVELAHLDVPFVTSLGVGAHLQSWGIPPQRIIELDWWESTEIRGVRITAAPSQHFSGRSIGDRNRTAWSSFDVRTARRSVFFSGDTGLTPEYEEIRTRLGAFDLVMLEVGAFHPAWGDIHLGPKNALAAHALLGGGALLPVHWGTFNLAMHAWDEPAETLLELGSAAGVPLLMPRLGEPVEPTSHESAVKPWWRNLKPSAAPIINNALVNDPDATVSWPVD